jgi:putative tributyrin esterase
VAIFECKMFSKVLFSSVSVNVILPTPESGDYFFNTKTYYPEPGQKYQVLYLLHGFTADFSDWARFSGIERYAQEKQLAVVMPSANNSRYCNLPGGGNYFDYYTKELPEYMQSMFPLSTKRENNFIAGLSMGGGGSIKAALRCPEKYAAVASLSGSLSSVRPGTDERNTSPINTEKWTKGAFGEKYELYDPNKECAQTMLRNCVDKGIDIPKMYVCCGTEDFLYNANCDFRDLAVSLKVDFTYEEAPGVHNWDFWDPFIRRVIHWLPLKNGFVD